MTEGKREDGKEKGKQKLKISESNRKVKHWNTFQGLESLLLIMTACKTMDAFFRNGIAFYRRDCTGSAEVLWCSKVNHCVGCPQPVSERPSYPSSDPAS